LASFCFVFKNNQLENLGELVCDFSQTEILLADVVEAFRRNLKFPTDIQAFKS